MSKPILSAVDTALEQVNENRRGFLGKLLAGTAAAAALPSMASVALAQNEGGQGKGKGAKGKGGKGKGGQRDPAELAKRLMREHDKDDDGKLNLEELTAALKALMSRRGAGRGDAKGKGKGAAKGKGKGDRS